MVKQLASLKEILREIDNVLPLGASWIYVEDIIEKALKEQRKTVSERIGKMKLKKRSENDLTMYLGYGVPEIDYRVGYNQAIDNILEHL